MNCKQRADTRVPRCSICVARLKRLSTVELLNYRFIRVVANAVRIENITRRFDDRRQLI